MFEPSQASPELKKCAPSLREQVLRSSPLLPSLGHLGRSLPFQVFELVRLEAVLRCTPFEWLDAGGPKVLGQSAYHGLPSRISRCFRTLAQVYSREPEIARRVLDLRHAEFRKEEAPSARNLVLFVLSLWMFDVTSNAGRCAFLSSQVQVPGVGSAPSILMFGENWQLQWAAAFGAALFQLKAGELWRQISIPVGLQR